MSDKTVSVGVRFDGDASKLNTELRRAEADLRDLGKTASSIKVLENAVADVSKFEGQLQAARIKVRALQTALSEAYAADADAPLLKKLNSELGKAETAATRAEKALEKSQSAVVKLNLAAGAAGVNTTNLAAAKSQLAVESGKVSAKIDALRVNMEQSAAAARNMAAGARSVSSAFATLNIRSAEKINADIERVNQALVRLASNSKVSGADFDRAYAGAQVRLAALRAELAGTEAAAGKTSTAVSGMGASLAGLAGVGAGLAIGREFVKANVAAESLERTLVQLTGSGEAAAAEIDYLKVTSNRLGLSLQETSRAYINLTAAAKGTTLEGAGTRQVFEAVAGSMAKLGRSSADTEGALQAVSQMMSKGVVSMEEWRQQLGERLPGALKATADAAGLETEQLNKMIESGKVLSSDLLPLMAVGLEKVYGTAGQAEGSVAAWSRLKNSISETMVFVGDSGVWKGLVLILEGLSKAVRGVTAGFDMVGRTVGNIGGLLTEVWTSPAKALAHFTEEQVRARDEIMGSLEKIEGASTKTNAAQAKQAQDDKLRTAEKADAAAMNLKLAAAYEDITRAATGAVVQSEKSAKAREEEGKAAQALANAFGNETEKRTASLQAAKTDADALRALADARRLEAGIADAYAKSLEALAGEENKRTQAQRDAIAEAKKSAEAKQADADKSAAAALAAQQHAAALATETEMLKDNSGRLTELKAAADAAGLALENLRKLKEQGVATDTQVKEAEIAAGQAKAIYRDALNDQTKAIEYNARIKQSELDLKGAGLKLEIEQLRSMAEVAKAYGDESAAAYYLLEAKRMEIELAELQAKAKRAEGEAALQMVAAKRAELAASGQLTAAKEAELKAQELGAQVKLKEGEIAAETADRMRQLFDATMKGAAASEKATGSYDKLAGSLDGVANSAKRAADAQNGLSDTGVRTASGSAAGKIGGGSQADFTETLYRRGGSIEEVKLAQKYVGELYARNQATMLTGDRGNEANASRLMQMAINDAVDKALAAARDERRTGKAVDLGTSVADLQARNLARTPLKSLDDMILRIKNAGNEAKAQVHRIELVSGNKKSSLSGSESDVSNFMKILEEHKLRAG